VEESTLLFPFPMVDVTLGMTGVISFGQAFRIHLTPAIGTWGGRFYFTPERAPWQTFNPAAKFLVTFNLFDTLMVSGQVQLVGDFEGFTQPLPTDYALIYGGGLGIAF
jgi:hypothetical protein